MILEFAVKLIGDHSTEPEYVAYVYVSRDFGQWNLSLDLNFNDSGSRDPEGKSIPLEGFSPFAHF